MSFLLTERRIRNNVVASHFLDSGSFSLWTEAKKYARRSGEGKWSYYDSPEYFAYVDAYAEFIKANADGIDYFANVDVIPNPELSWRNLKYLEEKHGLRAVPVVHYKTDLEWIEKHIEAGYTMIGLGGLVGSTGQDHCIGWIDRVFDLVCDTPDRLPRVRLHGFGVTHWKLFTRYPWYSVDSTSWIKKGGYGLIYVPHKRGGEFIFTERPYAIGISAAVLLRKKRDQHFLTLSRGAKRVVLDWLERIDVPLGKVDAEGNTIEEGVLTRHSFRKAANVRFYREMAASLPAYPWPFRSARRRGFGGLS